MNKKLAKIRDAAVLYGKLEALKKQGLTFGDCVLAFGIKRDDDPITAAAHEMYGRDGEIEIDDTTVRSGSDDDGDYVLAWVWVYNTDAGLPSKDTA